MTGLLDHSVIDCDRMRAVVPSKLAEILDILIANSGFAPVHSLLPSFRFGDFYGAFQTPAFRRRCSVDQPVTWFMSGNNISANVYLGESSSPEVEAEILDRVGTYGKQLGQITDAMIVLLKHLPDRESLTRKRVM